jgi:hypothetical protein
MRSPAAADELCTGGMAPVELGLERRQKPHVLSEIAHVKLAERLFARSANEKICALVKFFIDNGFTPGIHLRF